MTQLTDLFLLQELGRGPTAVVLPPGSWSIQDADDFVVVRGAAQHTHHDLGFILSCRAWHGTCHHTLSDYVFACEAEHKSFGTFALFTAHLPHAGRGPQDFDAAVADLDATLARYSHLPIIGSADLNTDFTASTAGDQERAATLTALLSNHNLHITGTCDSATRFPDNPTKHPL